MEPQGVSWARFFALRRRLRVWQRVGGVSALAACLGAEAALLSLPVFDASATARLGVDPLVAVGALTAAGCAASYVAGAALIGALFRVLRPSLSAALDARQRDYYARVVRWRANVAPSAARILRRGTDFYGERVSSVADYRTWLRLQRRVVREAIRPEH